MECTGSSRPRHGQTFVPLAAALRSVAFASVVAAADGGSQPLGTRASRRMFSG